MRSRVAVAVALAAGTLFPAAADAHGITGSTDLPIPQYLFAWGAAIVLAASFAALATGRVPSIAGPERPRFRLPRALPVLAGALGLAAFALFLISALGGTGDPDRSLAPVTVFVLLWVLLPLASAALGDLFRPLSPWRSAALAARAVARRALPRARFRTPWRYPERLGHWPAVLAILGFAWLELVDVHRDDPRRLGLLALIYAIVQLLGMGAFGIERWSTRADGFGAAFSLYGRAAPVTAHDRTLFTRRPLGGLAQLTDPPPATAALACALIGATGFDGFSNTAVWGETGAKLIQHLIGSGWSFSAATELIRGAGLLLAVLLTFGLYRLGAGSARAARIYAPSLVPIALGYLLAHYFSLLVTQIQAVPPLVAHPLGPASPPHLDPRALSTATIWYVQFAALLAGHVAGLVVAHERALALSRGDARAAGRSQRGLLCVMVAFTCAGLYILSAVAT